MAIYPLQSNYIIDVDIITTTSFKAGMVLMRDDNGRAIPADNASLLYLSLQRKVGKILGFASSDHDAFGNTIIVPDVIGSSYLDENRNFVRFENPEVRTIKRALPDLQDPASNNINPTDRTVVSKRGIGVYNQSGEVYITDQFVRVLHGDFGQDFTDTVVFNSGDLLTLGSGVNAGKLVKVNVNSIGTDIIVVGVVEKYIAATDLLHFKNAFYSVTFSSSSAVMALDAGNRLSFPNAGSIGTVCGITLDEGRSMTLTAPAGHVFDKVLFASYGTPDGVCGSFTIGSCHASTSQSAVEAILLGNNSGIITQGPGTVGMDPCGGVYKRFYVQARFAPTLAKDLTVFNNSGTLTNGVSYDTAGGGSWAFDGTNDRIVIPKAGLVYGTVPKTLMSWAKLSVYLDAVQVIAAYGNAGLNSGFFIAVYQLQGQGGGFNNDLFGGTVALNTWFHICNVYDGSIAYLYLNGSLVASGAKSWNTTLSTYDGTIGCQINPQQYWNGNISDVRLYNRALSASEISAYYNASKSRYGL